MKQKWIIIIPLVLVMLLVCVAILGTLWFAASRFGSVNFDMPALGDMRFSAEAEEQKVFQVKSPATLNVTNFAGFVHVESVPVDKIDVTVKKTAIGVSQQAAQENLNRLKVTMTQLGDTLTIDVDLDSRTNRWPGAVDFTITVPEETIVHVKSETGDLSLTGTKGDAELNTSFGAVRADDIEGALTIWTRNGRVEAREIQSGTEKIELRSDFGDVILANAAGGPVTIRSSNGGLTLDRVEASGKMDVQSDFGRISIQQGSADELLASTQNGQVTLDDLKVNGSATVRSDFGGLALTNVQADGYDLRSVNGQVKLDGASGSIKASSDFGPVEVKNARDAVLELNSNNGSVTFEGSLGKGAQSLHSGFGAVTLRLPAKAAFDFDLRTDFGKISSEYEITIQGAPNEKHWIGKINGGGDLLTVTTNNGNITLEINQSSNN